MMLTRRRSMVHILLRRSTPMLGRQLQMRMYSWAVNPRGTLSIPVYTVS